ncbi:hypothetical protein Taro_039254 [Colocasia esculenta]|uniref:Uncharacterized protein n=1 Tax=Colocasia esculenta TaxID=4460 RepID=A0A843WLN2_COLES|nr:hypothetical protein [Colocasia esculenta]
MGRSWGGRRWGRRWGEMGETLVRDSELGATPDGDGVDGRRRCRTEMGAMSVGAVDDAGRRRGRHGDNAGRRRRRDRGDAGRCWGQCWLELGATPDIEMGEKASRRGRVGKVEMTGQWSEAHMGCTEMGKEGRRATNLGVGRLAYVSYIRASCADCYLYGEEDDGALHLPTMSAISVGGKRVLFLSHALWPLVHVALCLSFCWNSSQGGIEDNWFQEFSGWCLPMMVCTTLGYPKCY